MTEIKSHLSYSFSLNLNIYPFSMESKYEDMESLLNPDLVRLSNAEVSQMEQSFSTPVTPNLPTPPSPLTPPSSPRSVMSDISQLKS